MKNILVISEVFKRGGLETQIDTFYKELNKDLNFTFIFGEYNGEWNFGKSKIYTNIKFNDKSSINEFNKVVKQMVEIIEENKIDVIHTHPFHLAIPAIFAAQITKTPICYTYHGFVSLTYPNSINIQTIFDYSLNELFSKIFCVYKNIAKSLEMSLRNSDVVFLPNPIDLNKFKFINSSKKSRWAMTCRLDSDKVDSICNIMYSLKKFGINELHLYGSGNSEEYIKKIIKKNKLENKVFMHGYVNNTYEALKQNYTGVIGMGRSASEAVAMRLPTMLVGYDKNCGIINKDNYEEVMNNNFAPIFLEEKDNDYVKKQVQSILKNGYKSDIYDNFKKDCSALNVSKKYLDEINNIEVNIRSNFLYFYREIEKINSDECFATSRKIYNLSYKFLKGQSLDLSLNTTMVYYNSMQNQIDQLNAKIEILKKKNEKTIKKINIKFLFKNTFKIIKKKIKK